ncbi:GNAT family N-acetyltransferase [Rubellimicrobium arenae]|uniref:GNAT family N-acetyltransferase n=1 Tax=Rubellimicrobium arenae TaxID=2817372 RepID=UPI001B313A7B|nr:N-acetyltransferase [Rubellimicrobium arenae]
MPRAERVPLSPTTGPCAYRLAEETADDWWEVEALLDLCFAPGREALSSYRLREGVAPVAALCLVARDGEGALAGAIRNWPVRVAAAGGRRWALLLGPVAVHPTRQGEGLGAMLILRALELAREGGWSRVLLVGDLPYYRRFGFQRLAGVAMPPPTNPERILGLNLREGAWTDVTGPVLRAIS